MPGAAPQQNQGGEGHMGPLWIIAAIFVTVFFIWYTCHTYIVAGYFTLKRYEINFLQFFNGPTILEDVKDYLDALSPANVAFPELTRVSKSVGNYMLIPILPVLASFAFILFFRSSSSRFRETYNMKTLFQKEIVNWPQMTPVLNVDLLHTDLNDGAWAMSLQPMQFAKKFGLLEEYQPELDEGRLSKETILKVRLKKEEATVMFSKQLGAPWKGVNYLRKHEKALFAAFSAKLCRDSDGCRNFLDHIAYSTRTGKIDFSEVDDFLKKFCEKEEVIKITKSHAYVLTVFSTLLDTARLDGVLSSADFVWLKPVDRRLWYMLNSVGRQTPFVEVAGPFAHWLAEKAIGRKLRVPMVEQAVSALDDAIQDVIYKPDREY